MVLEPKRNQLRGKKILKVNPKGPKRKEEVKEGIREPPRLLTLCVIGSLCVWGREGQPGGKPGGGHRPSVPSWLILVCREGLDKLIRPFLVSWVD